MLDKLQNLNPTIQNSLCEDIAKLKCGGNDYDLVNRFHDFLMGIKAQRPEIARKYS